MKKAYFILFLLLYSSINSQEKSNSTIKYNFALKEKIFVHYNSSFLVAGEYLQYKVYNIRDRNKKLSKLSKIAYIELINSDKKVVFKHKIRLQNGTGIGEYFLPSSLKSGNYKLISYTQAMRNEGEDYFFQGDISIINPFQGIDQNLVVKKITSKDKETIAFTNYTPVYNDDDKKDLEIAPSSKTYKNRSEVLLKIKNLNNSNLDGSYSISVRKINKIQKPKLLTSKTYSSIFPEKIRRKNYISKFTPEFEGDIIIGKVILKNTKLPAANIRVALSIPNEKHVLKFAETDNSGKFIYRLKAKFSANNATIQVLDKNKDNYSIQIEKKIDKNYNDLVFNNFRISTNIKDILLENSIQNQIENSYQSIKLDSISDKKIHQNYLFNSKSETFILDDYTRFPTVKETILEIVKNVKTRKRKGQYIFDVTKLNPYDKEVLTPIIIVDGILTQSLNELAEFDAKKVKSISVIRDKFYYGSFKFQGIVSVTTFNNDFTGNLNKSYINKFTLFTPIKNRKYYSQKYDSSKKNDRIPDYRRQLLWDPNFSINSKNEISFFSSDVKGVFEISIEGFHQDGTPVSSKELITIE